MVFFQIMWVREKCRVGLIWELCNFFGVCGNNGKQGSNKWAELYAMSMDGSPVYYDNEGGGGSPEESEPEMVDDSDGVVCSGLDHADSQGLNKTNQRLR